jgi:polyhydroxyalkanoate synthesis regulator phasin
MTQKTLHARALLGLIILSAGSLYAQQDQALIDALVRKGILSQKEARQIQAEVQKEAVQPTAPSESKIKLGDWVQELKLYGDIRLRYQYDTEQPQIPPAPLQTDYSNVSQRSRWRFRLRLNADFKLADNFFGGFGLQTNAAADSANQTYTQGFDNYGIFINKAYLGYAPIDGITVIAGKQTNPFYTTDLFWDPDINPQGLVERIDFHKLFNMTFGESGYAKDGKAPVAPPPEPARNALEVSLIAGQLIFYDNN